MAKHDFGILDQFEENKWYQEYEPEKYNCVSVDMDVMDEVFSMYLEEMRQIKAFACISTQPICGLEESGITLIPPYSLKSFCDVITKANRQIQSHQLILLIDKILKKLKKLMDK